MTNFPLIFATLWTCLLAFLFASYFFGRAVASRGLAWYQVALGLLLTVISGASIATVLHYLIYT